MENLLHEYAQRIKDLEAVNVSLRDKLLEQEKLRKVYIDDLNNMKSTLGNLQDLLMKCRADILSQEMIAASDDIAGPKSEHGPGDTMSVVTLQAQLEVCKNDLVEQRAAHQELLIEKNRITSEMQNLLHKNHQLCMDQEQARGDQTSQLRTTGHPSGASKLYGTSPGVFERQIEPCPHCNNVFGDFLTLETHIKDCPGLDY
uniref:CCHC NOA-type domain-containing protein n=1 Tax=Anopheles atroparvus TaxID=41427 RepID=A0AAG5DK71_ANOAO